MLSSRGPGAPLSTLSWALAIWSNQTGTAWRPFAHWCTILRLVIFDGSLMHPWCRQATALLA
jgi:hypothetical protein